MGTTLMGIFKGRGLLHPRYFRHPVPSLESDYVALIEFTRLDSEANTPPEWDEEAEEWTSSALLPLWRGMARLQPNKDWRARNRTWASEETGEHALRIQMNLYKNLLVPKDEWPAAPVDIKHGDLVTVTSNPNDPVLEGYQFTVRNSMGASDSWLRTILCDVNLGTRV